MKPSDVQAINGHLTATMADPLEIKNWERALERKGENFPLIQSTKSMIGHALGASGALESVAVALQLSKGFFHPSINTEDLSTECEHIRSKVPQICLELEIKTIAKASFGFGDVNACILFKKGE
jgi:3-oxoacyl-(acyl-carrier-protein) synthase